MATQTKIPPLTVSNPWWGHDPSDKQWLGLYAYEECPDLFYGGAAGPGKTSYLLMPWGCLGCCVPAEIRLEGSDSGVLLAGAAPGELGVRFELAHLVSGVRRSPARGYLAPGSSVAWSGLGAWWRARGGWCEVLVLRTGGGWRTYLMFVDLRTTSRHGDQPPSPRPLRDGAALARPLSWHQVRFPWGLLDSLDVCPFL